MAYKQVQESHTNCMDGVRVKISEKYKPPPRINLAMTYSQRLHLNKQLQDSMPKYDFSLEASIKERMQEWKGARNAVAQERRVNLERIHKEHEKRLEEEKSAINENDVSQVLIPTQLSTNNFANILLPIPLSTQTTVMQPVEKSPINISDFEQDTCSPFDNMELKTINDMEELKLVLQNDDKKRSNYLGTTVSTHLNPYTSQESEMKFYNYNLGQTSSQSFPGNPVYTTTNGYSYYQAETLYPNMNSFLSTYNTKSSYEDNTLKPSVDKNNKLPLKSVTDIMKALHTDLNNVRIDPNKSKVKEGVGGRTERSPDRRMDNLENPYDQLSKNLQDLCSAIVAMGFPLPRVARACKNIGDDQKKIIDHMIAMSDLLDLGFKEESVSAALLQCNNDRDEALEKLIL